MFKNLKLKTKLILGFIIASLPILIIGYFSIYQMKQYVRPLEQDVPNSVQDISKKSYLNNLAEDIRYYDEVLTQSARNYASLQDKKWAERYGENVIKLDEAIKEALSRGDEQDKKYFTDIAAANSALVGMEIKVLELAGQGQTAGASQILESEEYLAQKNIFKDGLDKYAERRLAEKEKAIRTSLGSLASISENVKNSTGLANDFLIVFSIIAFFGSVIIGSMVTLFIVKKSTASEKKYKHLFDYSQDAIITLGPPDWKFTDGNSAAFKIFGLKDINELKKIGPGDVSPRHQPDGKLSGDKAKAMIGEAMKKGSNSFDWTHKKLNGPEFLANVSLARVETGEKVFLQAVVRDVTEQKRAIESIKKSEAEAKKALAETERANRLMVGRELEMIKLKKEIAELKK